MNLVVQNEAEKYISRVYAIDSVQDRFLLVDEFDEFNWVKISDCTLVRCSDLAEEWD